MDLTKPRSNSCLKEIMRLTTTQTKNKELQISLTQTEKFTKLILAQKKSSALSKPS